MTPDQIELVEQTVRSLDLPALAADFYRKAFALEPELAEMFTSDPDVQAVRFAAELEAILTSIRSMDDFAPATRELGARHRGYGVRSGHYRLMGQALLAALADALRDGWTQEVADAWTMAYNLVAESMLSGAAQAQANSRVANRSR